MNNCILMAEVMQEPELRYTADAQIPIAEMLVQFPNSKPDEPPATLKVVAWRDLAQEIQKRCRPGDRVIVEGSLNMNLIDRPEGFKEKRAELTAQKIYSLGSKEMDAITPPPSESTPSSDNVVSLESRRGTSEPPVNTSPAPVSAPPSPSSNPPEEEYDPIPF